MGGLEQSGFVTRPDGVRLAWSRVPGQGPAVVSLPGYRAHITGAKAKPLADWAAARGQAFLRFDPGGHGQSGGSFADGTIASWTEDARLVIEAQAPGPVVLAGSSMGGWIALLLAVRTVLPVQAVVGIAAAPDFTEDLMWESMAPPERAALERDGVLHVPSAYGDPVPVTRALIEDGRHHLLLRAPVPLRIPVRLLHGQRDPDVPWETALRVSQRLEGADVQVTLVKDGDHRLSRPQDLLLLTRTLELLLQDGTEPFAEGREAPGQP